MPVKPKTKGRPPAYTPEQIESHKQEYLSLLSQGKNEREIDEIEGMPGHTYRNCWLSDLVFAEQCSRARAIGADFNLQSACEKVNYAWERAKTGDANAAMVSLAAEYMRHARWLASKHNKQVYGDKTAVEVSGKDGKPIEFLNKPDDELNRRILELALKSGERGTAPVAGGEETPDSSE